MDKHGCCVMQKIIEAGNPNQKVKMYLNIGNFNPVHF
jgi:hypothetical protein